MDNSSHFAKIEVLTSCAFISQLMSPSVFENTKSRFSHYVDSLKYDRCREDCNSGVAFILYM